MSDLLASRYRVLGPLDPVGRVPRDLALDLTADARVEVSRFAGGPGRASFEALAARYAACHHPCLAPVIDVVPGAEEDAPLLVETHPGGPRLGNTILPRPAALLAAADIADALGALHAAGLVHGALGQEAVALDPVGRPQVLGAGTRALQAAALQVAEPPSSPGADVQALGRLLYEFVCGRPPDPVPMAPSSLSAGVDPALNGLILALLSDDPVRPPPPAGAVALRLRDLAGVGPGFGGPPAPPPPPAEVPSYGGYVYGPPQVRRPPRRGYSDAGLLAGAIALAIGGILAAYGFSRLEDEKTTTVTRTLVSTVERVVSVQVQPAPTITLPVSTDVLTLSGPTSELTTDLTDTSVETLTVPTDVTTTDPFVIPSVITSTVTQVVTETATTTQLSTETKTETETETKTETASTEDTTTTP